LPRFKHFHGVGAELESAINRWLDAFEPDIAQMAQTVDPNGNLVISFVYDESFRGQELRRDHEHAMADAAKKPVPAAVTPEDPVDVRATGPERGPEPDISAP
jgi:hypothetical protein